MASVQQLAAPREAMGRAMRRVRAQSRRSRATWQLTFNLARRLDHLRRPGLSAPAGTHVDTLRHNGVLIAPWDDVVGVDARPVFDALQAQVAVDLADRADEVAALRHSIADEGLDRSTSTKQFIVRLRDEAKGFDPRRDADPYLAVATHPRIVEVVEGYLGMRATLMYANAWLCLPTPDDDSAHLWHRDPEDRHIVKVFIYLDGVAPPQGPFEYATGSQPDSIGPWPTLPARHGREPRFDDDAMAGVVAVDRWVQAVGPAGTVLVADTAGYHKGPNRVEDRLTFVATYVSAAAQY